MDGSLEQDFSFSLPAAFTKADVRPIDSFCEKYVSDGIDVSFDYGEYSNDFSDWPEGTRFERTIIDGKPAKIGTARQENSKSSHYITQIYVKLDGPVALSMSADCRSKKEVALARTIFLSINFHGEKSGG